MNSVIKRSLLLGYEKDFIAFIVFYISLSINYFNISILDWHLLIKLSLKLLIDTWLNDSEN